LFYEGVPLLRAKLSVIDPYPIGSSNACLIPPSCARWKSFEEPFGTMTTKGGTLRTSAVGDFVDGLIAGIAAMFDDWHINLPP